MEPRNKKNEGRFDRRAQSTLEFTFAMVMIIMLIIGMIRVFAWTGRDLVERRIAHEETLTRSVGGGYAAQLKQTTPRFYGSADVNATWESNMMFQP